MTTMPFAPRDYVPVLAELRRVLKPGGVLRLVLPDLLKGVDAYRRGDRDYFLFHPFPQRSALAEIKYVY